ncbi:hypothetical protein ACFL1X_06140 [Candidatus Hydrogenedentota bacterium]
MSKRYDFKRTSRWIKVVMGVIAGAFLGVYLWARMWEIGDGWSSMILPIGGLALVFGIAGFFDRPSWWDK